MRVSIVDQCFPVSTDGSCPNHGSQRNTLNSKQTIADTQKNGTVQIGRSPVAVRDSLGFGKDSQLMFVRDSLGFGKGSQLVFVLATSSWLAIWCARFSDRALRFS
jgi:hypothetical protein